MNVKRKLSILTFLSLVFSLIVTVFPTNSAYAAEDDRILDIYGDPIATNKDYILVFKFGGGKHVAPVGANKHGFTYSPYNGWYYPLQYTESSYYKKEKYHSTKGDLYYGTPITFEVPPNNRGDGYLREGTPLVMVMRIGELPPLGGVPKYYMRSDSSTYLKKNDSYNATIFTVSKVNSKEFNLVIDKIDIYKDKFGRPTDSYNADPKQTLYNVEQVLRPFGSTYHEWWVQSESKAYAGLEVVPVKGNRAK
ncbi:hypothetical protein ACQVTS_29670 [Bacillus mycoides]|uniref:hypothetical protein n=1 Tax=Bacillus mycoides TaxID=1405 RepID=UPI003D66001A